jgi:VIT1/CCC1 family predicted Fe2+/Mn2+ transporter
MRPDSPPVGTRSRKRWGCNLVWTVSGSSLFFLALLGALAAYAGGAPVLRSVARVVFGGAFAMALTAVAGDWVGRIG